MPKTHCQRNDIRRTAGKPTAVHTALAADGNNAVAYQGRCNRRRSLMQKNSPERCRKTALRQSVPDPLWVVLQGLLPEGERTIR